MAVIEIHARDDAAAGQADPWWLATLNYHRWPDSVIWQKEVDDDDGWTRMHPDPPTEART